MQIGVVDILILTVSFSEHPRLDLRLRRRSNPFRRKLQSNSPILRMHGMGQPVRRCLWPGQLLL